MKTLKVDNNDRAFLDLALSEYRRTLTKHVEDCARLGVDDRTIMGMIRRVDDLLRRINAKGGEGVES